MMLAVRHYGAEARRSHLAARAVSLSILACRSALRRSAATRYRLGFQSKASASFQPGSREDAPEFQQTDFAAQIIVDNLSQL